MTIGPSLNAHPMTAATPQAPQQPFRVRHQQTLLTVQATPSSIRIDGQPTRDALSLRTPMGLVAQDLSKSRADGYRAIRKVAARGERFQNISSGEQHVVANLAREEYTSTSIPGLRLESLPAPALQFTPKTVRMLWRTTEQP
jgi:hypothetical protein